LSEFFDHLLSDVQL